MESLNVYFIYAQMFRREDKLDVMYSMRAASVAGFGFFDVCGLLLATVS